MSLSPLDITGCHDLLSKVLQDAFQVSSILFTPPYGDLKKIDFGIRATIWSDMTFDSPKDFFRDDLPPYRIIIIKSNLGFYNILATLGSGNTASFISVGPFRDNELSANYFTQILKESQVAPSEIQSIKYMYERMPLAQVDAVVNVMKHILETYIPDFREVTSELIQFSDQKRMVSINNDLINDFSMEYSERYKARLAELMQYIISGDSKAIRDTLKLFLKETMLLNRKNMREYKTVLQLLNDYCHTALLQTSIHPHYVLKQASSIRVKIEEETSLTRLEQMPNEICHKYYLLVKNYAHAECSKLTKDIMSYIHFHLEEELSLRTLAEYFDRNPSALSTMFSKDTGQSITAYIQQTRIDAAIKLFNTTNMSVAEVATSVGYQDFAYFSKVFSRYVGCSPRTYKNTR